MELNGWTSPQMLRRYGASARSARARRTGGAWAWLAAPPAGRPLRSPQEIGETSATRRGME
jgi:hypothetical protein